MTLYKDIVSLWKTDTIRDAAMLVCRLHIPAHRHAYSRYPVFGHSKNDLTGLVMSYDILKALIEGREQEPVSTIC